MVLEARSLSKSYGNKRAVEDVSLTAEPGDALGLLGPNGAGKSTTILMLVGLLEPDEGDVWLDGRSIRQDPRYFRQHIGLVPQRIALYERLTAEENLRFWGRVYGLTGKALAAQVEWCLELAGLTEHRRERVAHFSAGMQRRLNVAVGLVHRPKLLIMDEPTVGIDPQSRGHILDTVRRLNAEGMTVLYTSHYMEEVEYLCRRVAILDHGQVIAYGSIDDVRRLAGALSTVRLTLPEVPEDALAALRQNLTLRNVVADGNTVLFQTQEAGPAIARAVQVLADHGLHPARIDVDEPNLEAAFLHLTGRRLRDGGEEA